MNTQQSTVEERLQLEQLEKEEKELQDAIKKLSYYSDFKIVDVDTRATATFLLEKYAEHSRMKMVHALKMENTRLRSELQLAEQKAREEERMEIMGFLTVGEQRRIEYRKSLLRNQG